MGRVFFRKLTLRLLVYALTFTSGTTLPIFSQQERWEQSITAGKKSLNDRDFESAEINFKAALEQSLSFASNDSRKAKSLIQMARFYRALGDFARPEVLYQKALIAAELALDPDALIYADYKHELAGYYHARRKYTLAEKYYREAFEKRVHKLGREHADVGVSINDLGVLYENKAIFTKAHSYYKYALQIREELLGADHIETIETVEHMIRLLSKTNQSSASREFMMRAQSVRQALVEHYNQTKSKPKQFYTLNEVHRNPRVKTKVVPEYTDQARIGRQEGSVLLQVVINSSGQVAHFRLLRSLGLGLDEKAVEAVNQWTFRPARKDGKRVAVLANLEILFSLM